MNSTEIIELYSYNDWANKKLLEFVNTLDLVDFTRDMSNSFRSIRDTIVHIVGAEVLWLSRWQGEVGRGLLDARTFPNLTSVYDRWHNHKLQIHNFVSSLTDDQLNKTIRFRDTHGIEYSLELWKQMLHMFNHSTQHRGQIITMGRQLKLQPPSLDIIYYYLGHR